MEEKNGIDSTNKVKCNSYYLSLEDDEWAFLFQEKEPATKLKTNLLQKKYTFSFTDDLESKIARAVECATKPMFQALVSDVKRKTCNYSYNLDSSEKMQFLIEEAKKLMPTMPVMQQTYYQKFMNSICYDKNGVIDTRNVGTLKAFLAFKKLLKYGGELKQDTRKGLHNEESPFLGDYYSEYSKFKRSVYSCSTLINVMNSLYQTLYSDLNKENTHLIPLSYSDEANKLSFLMANEEAKKYGIEDISSTYYHSDFKAGILNTCDIDNKWNNWNLQLAIHKGGYSNKNGMTPEGVVLLHELYHVKQSRPGEKADYTDDFMEIGPTIDRLVRSDEIRKKIENIAIEEIIEYPKFKIPNGKEINPGALVNKFRNIKNKTNLKTYEEVMLSEEGLKFIMEYFN